VKWHIDTSGKRFEISAPIKRKADFTTGEAKVDPVTKAPLWVVPLAAKDPEGIELINVTVAGEEPKATVGQLVQVQGLEVGQYAMTGKNGSIKSGLWFRASAIVTATAKQ
jgi:hypothetical protein